MRADSASAHAGARARKQLEQARRAIKRDSRQLRAAYTEPPWKRGVAAKRQHAITTLRGQLQRTRGSLLAEQSDAPAFVYAERALWLWDQGLKRLAAAAKHPGGRDRAKHTAEAAKLLKQAKAESVKAGRVMPGGWPL